MKCLLLDRDGVLNAEREDDCFVPEDMTPLPGVIAGLLRLRDFRFFVVSNQSAVGRGLIPRSQVETCNETLIKHLHDGSIVISDLVFCPHRPDDGCSCRKPKTGMWEILRDRHGLKAEDCVMVGNRGSDVAFGRTIGCPTVFVISALHTTEGMSPDFTVRDMPELADLILSRPWPIV